MCHAAVIAAPCKPNPDDLQIDRIDQVGWIDPEALSVDIPLASVRRPPSVSELDGSCDDPDGDAEFLPDPASARSTTSPGGISRGYDDAQAYFRGEDDLLHSLG